MLYIVLGFYVFDNGKVHSIQAFLPEQLPCNNNLGINWKILCSS